MRRSSVPVDKDLRAMKRAELHAEALRLARRLRALEARGGLEERLRRYGAVLAELAKSDELAREDFRGFVRLATERATDTLAVARSSLWFFSPDRSVLRCENLYEAAFRRHSRGTELEASRYPAYFAALARGRVVAAHDARRDAATREFADGYLRPLGIGALLDTPLRRGGRLIGVVCNEHVGGRRRWLPEEQEFAASIAEFVALALETSERRRAEEAFRAAQGDLLLHQQQEKQLVDAELERVKGDLVRQTRLATVGHVAASIAHELRNPLAAIGNAVYYLGHRTPAGDPKWTEYLGIIQQEVHQADRIVGDLLDMSRAREPCRTAVDLAELARASLTYLHGHDGVELELRLDPDPFFVHADGDQLRQVLTNLFTNSAQALAGAPGRITVRALHEGPTDLILVADDGPGVAPAVRRQVFEPLFTTKAKGTGLGLSICRTIVEAHGGTIELGDSVRGALVCIRMPSRPAA